MMSRMLRIISTRQAIKRANAKGNKIYWGTGIDKDTIFEGLNTTWKGSACPSCIMGRASYIGTNTKLINTYIGRYTSIAADVSIIFGNHPSRDFVSTHSAFCFQDGYMECYTNKRYCYTSEKTNPYADAEKKYYCVIGNDVWIGKGAKIKCGIKIGDGAIVGAYAVVTKDVPPYAIMGGVPARLIRYRFDDEDVKWLQELKWWDRDKEWLQQYGKYFYDIKELRKTFLQEKMHE